MGPNRLSALAGRFTVDSLMQSALALVLKHRAIDKIPFIWFWPDGAPSCAMITHDVEATAGRDFCSHLMDLDDSYGMKSAFQIVPEGRYETSIRFFENLRGRGFETNLHDLNHDGRLFQNRQEFLRRAEQINGYARRVPMSRFPFWRHVSRAAMV